MYNSTTADWNLAHYYCECRIRYVKIHHQSHTDNKWKPSPHLKSLSTGMSGRSPCNHSIITCTPRIMNSCTTISITTTTTINQACPNTTIIASSFTSADDRTVTTTITHSSSPICSITSTLPVAAHGGYIAVILVLLAIIIILGILMGYLVKRTTPQRGTVQTTHQPLTDMTASDYMEPVALRQLQTSTEPGQ